MNNNSYYVQGSSIPQSYYNHHRPNRPYRPRHGESYDDRFGFLGPFLLGGITGGLVAPLFYGNQRPYYYNYNYYPYYPPYYY
jgi:hypothetical protein